MKSSEIPLGEITWNRSDGRLYDAAHREIELRHQTREVLSALAEAPGRTLGRDALIEAVWSGRAVSSDSVAQCIAEIRRALGDTGKKIVETVPREGYRLNPTPTPARPRRRAYATAALLLAIAAGLALWGGRPGSPAAPPVIAILPFDDYSPQEHRGLLSDAVSENIIAALARNPQLTVIARTSSAQFRGAGLGIAEIADRLGADYIVEGSQQYDGSRLRIVAQLIDGKTEAHLWSDEMDVTLDDLLEANSRISARIANAVGFSIVDTAEAKMSAGDVSALMISNAAQSRIMRNFTRENLLINLEEQDLAIRDYPESAWGYLGQALALRNGLRHGWIEGEEAATRERMERLARKAVELDPNNFMAHHALGRVLMYNKDVEAAIGAFRRGAELNPSSSMVLIGLADALIFTGETEQALDVVAQVEQIDPLYGFSLAWTKAWALWQADECEMALETFLGTPTMPVAAYKDLAAIHHCLGNAEKASEAIDTYLAQNPTYTLARIKEVETGMWTAPGALDRWLGAMAAVGVPPD
ncbi:winged helix-turn-helix domain-containing protein [Jannaschia seohaensis]|uniref:winged helix-turn-helix domain-containing protein n=1 Tax=Jannaschia seohaensis TaxID=475081 RepID=UPI001FE7DFD1|nr:winged helix-turn-helix domain-containing protein [Jannaschia seohaensis]